MDGGIARANGDVALPGTDCGKFVGGGWIRKGGIGRSARGAEDDALLGIDCGMFVGGGRTRGGVVGGSARGVEDDVLLGTDCRRFLSERLSLEGPGVAIASDALESVERVDVLLNNSFRQVGHLFLFAALPFTHFSKHLRPTICLQHSIVMAT